MRRINFAGIIFTGLRFVLNLLHIQERNEIVRIIDNNYCGNQRLNIFFKIFFKNKKSFRSIQFLQFTFSVSIFIDIEKYENKLLA